MVSITFMVDFYYIYGWYYIYGFYYIYGRYCNLKIVRQLSQVPLLCLGTIAHRKLLLHRD